jgi:hypothetical protein
MAAEFGGESLADLGTGLMVAVGVAIGFRSHASVLDW